MTGIGEVFELYEEWKARREKEKDKDKELEPEPEPEVIKGYPDEDSDWFYVIQQRDWDALLDMIQHYDYTLYKPKEPDKKKERKLRAVKVLMWVKEKVRPTVEKELPLAPLMGLNEREQTPLHAAIEALAPDNYIVRMVFCERRASLLADSEGRLPVHLSCICERNVKVIDRMIRANFENMQALDNHGKTALYYAVENAKKRKAEDGIMASSDYWGIPRNREESEWQERQEVHWEKVRFILLSYMTRRKIMTEVERQILLDILENAAPPSVVELVILASQGMLHLDPTLASSALRIFMKRQYPIKNLQLLLHHFPQQRAESMEAARRILTNQYHLGCRTLPGRSMSFRAEMEKHALEDNYKRTLPCQEWWDKIRCLLRLCGHQNDKEKRKEFSPKHLLHAALSNSDTPPSLVQLLMVISPESIRMSHPVNNSLLIHLMCRNWRYNLFPHSAKLGVELEMEEPPMEQVLRIILASDKTLTRKRHEDRLPLHHAIISSKSLDFLNDLVEADVESLCVRDPVTKLYPFQMAAMKPLSRNTALWAHAKYTPSEWKALEPEERAEAVDVVRDEQDRQHLMTIFELLRAFPPAVSSATLFSKPAEFRDTQGKGLVSAHYLVLLYEKTSEDQWDLQKENLKLIHDSINLNDIAEELEQWWSKLKFWIRYCYAGNESLSQEDDFLLHAAVSNSDTPPLIIELLLAIYPESASLPFRGAYPLHIAAATDDYAGQFFEVIETRSVLEMLVEAYPEAAVIESPNGFPLQIAKASGKSDEDLHCLMGAQDNF